MTVKNENIIFDGEILSLIVGKLEKLHVARTTVNLLEEIEKNVRSKSLASGVGAALSDMHGALANSAMLALYDGEDMYNFAAVINGEIVCGVFEKADKFNNGDQISAVVSKRGNVFHVHSMLRKNDHLLLMPLTTFSGKKAFFRNCMRVAWRFSIGAWIFISIIFMFFQSNDPLDQDTLTVLILMGIIIPPSMMFPMEYWTYRSMGIYGERASAIFKVYGFPRPDDLDVLSGMTHYTDSGYGYGGINCELALRNHKVKFNIKD